MATTLSNKVLSEAILPSEGISISAHIGFDRVLSGIGK